MKKVLFATTALVASAGFAAADVDLSGSAEMGVVGGDYIGETQFFQSVDVRFTMTGETDNGLSFGATIDLDDIADGAISDTTNNVDGIDPVDVSGGQFADYTVFLSGNFGTITMGDTDGAFDWALSEVALAGGTINDAETEHDGYNGNAGLDGIYDGQVVRYDHSVGDFSFAVSAEIDDTGTNDAALGVGGKYSGDLGGVTLGVGLGYQTGEGADEVYGISLTAAMDNGLSLALNYSDVNREDRDPTSATFGDVDIYTHMAIGIAYTMDALTIAANYGEADHDAASDGSDGDGWGILANYDLGGGATVQAGYGSGYGDAERWSLGVAMSF